MIGAGWGERTSGVGRISRACAQHPHSELPSIQGRVITPTSWAGAVGTATPPVQPGRCEMVPTPTAPQAPAPLHSPGGFPTPD